MLAPVAFALLFAFYTWTVRLSVGRIDGRRVQLDILVLDDATGHPVRDAVVYLPDAFRRPAAVTDAEGKTMSGLTASGQLERGLKRAWLGFIPIAGAPEVIVDPTGMHISADGYEPHTLFLNEAARDAARPLLDGMPLPVVVRLKRAQILP